MAGASKPQTSFFETLLQIDEASVRKNHKVFEADVSKAKEAGISVLQHRINKQPFHEKIIIFLKIIGAPLIILAIVMLIVKL